MECDFDPNVFLSNYDLPKVEHADGLPKVEVADDLPKAEVADHLPSVVITNGLLDLDVIR